MTHENILFPKMSVFRWFFIVRFALVCIWYWQDVSFFVVHRPTKAWVLLLTPVYFTPDGSFHEFSYNLKFWKSENIYVTL